MTISSLEQKYRIRLIASFDSSELGCVIDHDLIPLPYVDFVGLFAIRWSQLKYNFFRHIIEVGLNQIGLLLRKGYPVLVVVRSWVPVPLVVRDLLGGAALALLVLFPRFLFLLSLLSKLFHFLPLLLAAWNIGNEFLVFSLDPGLLLISWFGLFNWVDERWLLWLAIHSF